jgi:hypothetical protein
MCSHEESNKVVRTFRKQSEIARITQDKNYPPIDFVVQ